MTRPPKVAERLLQVSLGGGSVARSILGDLRQEFSLRASQDGTAARRWYWVASTGVSIRAILSRVLPIAGPVGKSATGGPSGGGGFEAMTRDLRLATRSMIRRPAFAATATLVLALGIGATTMMFSVVHAVLLDPLPYPDSDRLVGLLSTAPDLGYDEFPTSPGFYVAYEGRTELFESVGSYSANSADLSGDAGAERVSGAQVDETFFRTLGVTPLLGRFASAEEHAVNGPRVALISQGLWETRFGSDPDLLGTDILVSGQPTTIIGVLPKSVQMPSDDTALWTPMQYDFENPAPGLFSLNAIGKLAEGVTAEVAQTELLPEVDRVKEQYPDTPNFGAFLNEGQYRPVVRYLKDMTVDDLRAPLWLMLGTVAFILLIACANVANLFLVRVETHQRELAVKAALGAGRRTLVREFMTECLVLAGIGGILGLAGAWLALPSILGFAPTGLPRMDAIGITPEVVGFAILLSLIAALVFGLTPILRYTRPRTLAGVKGSGRGMSGSASDSRLRSGLVVAQSALALILLVGSGLLVRSFWEIRQTDPGFNPEDLLTFSVAATAASYPTGSDVGQFHDLMLERLGALPGVTSVGAISSIPLVGASGTAFEIDGVPTNTNQLSPMYFYKYATPNYFETLGIPVRVGREFEPSDHRTDAQTMILNEAAVRRIWPEGVDGSNEDSRALNRRIRFAATDSLSWQNVVGVVGSVRDHGLTEEPVPLFYFPILGPIQDGDNSWAIRSMTYAVRTADPEGLIPSVRATVAGIDPSLPISRVRTMSEHVSQSTLRLSFTMYVIAAGAAIALLLGAVGLYGVLSYAVSRRRQEIGVRMALGADQRNVEGMVVNQGVRLAIVGLGIGVVASLGLTRFLQSLLFETATLDPWVYFGMSGLLLCVGALASYLPARRAAGVDPAHAMRPE